MSYSNPKTDMDQTGIAIVGMACRFPEAPNIPAFWDLLVSGKNAVKEVSPGSGVRRVDELFSQVQNPGDACRFWAYVDEIDQFDPTFFRISPVEAEWLDPQHRMMLETSWHALEDAGIDPLSLDKSLTGVYTGISNDEYRMLVVGSQKPSGAAACLYSLSGTNLNGTSGRVSFFLGLRGPSKAVDAACASSLVAVHDAVSDLQYGYADLAIVGGVQAILNGQIFALRSDAMMLSPDGKCKTFDASANGYVRGEGCGVVILKRLSDAKRDGDRIWAVIRGSAVNHGGTGVGLTVPHTPALESVMETALVRGGLHPSAVGYIEAHGTGTAVGDPVELDAVTAVYGEGRPSEHPLLIGSVKTNMGHLESAAGIAGLIKAALVLRHGTIPKHLHFENPNPSLDWERHSLQVTSSMMEFPSIDSQLRCVGVNCFGISGTNAHVVVEEHRAEDQNKMAGPPTSVSVTLPDPLQHLSVPEQVQCSRTVRMLPLSAKSEPALRDLATRYLRWIDEYAAEMDDGSLADMAWTASIGRTHFDWREVVLFQNLDMLREKLSELSKRDPIEKPTAATRIAFVYTGQGSQWTGMGQSLYECEPVAKAVLDRCEQVFQKIRGVSLLDVMFGRVEGDMSDTAWEQPALYALECSLTALWASLGITPHIVIGHSVGEIAAAQAAGVFSLEDGMRFAIARGDILSATAPGAMVAIFAPTPQIESAIQSVNETSEGPGLCISGDNGTHRVVSGTAEDVDQISEYFTSEGIRAVRLNTSKAFHSALVEPALDALEESLKEIDIHPPTLALVSNLTGRPVEADKKLDGSYWRQHARHAVNFAEGIKAVAEHDVDTIIEIGPRPVLTNMCQAAWPASVAAPKAVPSLHPDDSPGWGIMQTVAEVYRMGLPVDFPGLFTAEARHRIPLPNYPFQKNRYWIETAKHHRAAAGHALLGVRHESVRGEITFETELFASDPDWMSDHRVFGRVIAPGALYGAMAIVASQIEYGTAVIERVQFHSPLVFSASESDDEKGRKVHIIIDPPESLDSRQIQIFSKGENEEEWTLHVQGHIPLRAAGRTLESFARIDPEHIRADMSPIDVASYYQARARTKIDLGPSFRTLRRLWARTGEALGEISLTLPQDPNEIHPLLLDGCFQVVAAARNPAEEGEITYLPFGWERLSLAGPIPEQILCHVQVSGGSLETEGSPEVISSTIRIYDMDGVPLGELSGYMVKRATQAAMLAAIEGIDELLYEVVWRSKPLTPRVLPADFLPSPGEVASQSGLLSTYLAEEGVEPKERTTLLRDLEHSSRLRALLTMDALGWEREKGDTIVAEDLQQQLGVIEEHTRLFRRILEMLAKSGILQEKDGRFVVKIASGDPLPDAMSKDIDAFLTEMARKYPHGVTEIGLFSRCSGALVDVLHGKADPLTLLFSSGDPTPGDLYLKAPVARAANRILKETIQTLIAELPPDRHLRIIEVGAGTGSATAAILPELPEGRFDYMYTDISAGFFAEAKARFESAEAAMTYRALDIEKDPIDQGFDPHGYDLLIASNVLHATRYLQETLAHCLQLLAPSGQLVALENMSGFGWMDLTFGQLDGWWRFADDYRPHHALASPAVWRRALADTGYGEVEILGLDESDQTAIPDKGVIVVQGPAEVAEPPGFWMLAADDGGVAESLATELANHQQTVILAHSEQADADSGDSKEGIISRTVDMDLRESWCSLLENIPKDVPLCGVVHLLALDGHGADATTSEMAEDVQRVTASALALTQAVLDSNLPVKNGIWFITQGVQVLERERTAQLAGAPLWGFGKAVSREVTHMQPRMIDLDSGESVPVSELAQELLSPDIENHIAYRWGSRQAARLVRASAETRRLHLPEDSAWGLVPNPSGILDSPSIKTLSSEPLEPKEIRVAVQASGLNFWDVFRSLGFIEEGDLGREMVGIVTDIGSEVSTLAVGDRVVGLGFGAFASEMITREELAAPAPPGFSSAELATLPSAFVSAALSYEFSGLEPEDRVLIHAGAGGVGLAAIQMAQAAGAEVFATASPPKQDYLRSLGVKHVFNSRETDFGEQILEATSGAGIHIVLNSLTSEGFIDASLSCLAEGGRFVELARRDILSKEEMAQLRPDVAYEILELDVLKKTDPAWVGRVLRDILKRLPSGELRPITHSRWPLAEAGSALRFMQLARHVGKIVVSSAPLARGPLRSDGTYLVTGGLGGIGCAVANWLAEHGAGTIALNGRRPPDEDAQEVIDRLRSRGVTVRVEIADVTDTEAIDNMMLTLEKEAPPIAGVIHSVGVLSDGALGNQNWDRFERVLWPKILGAWHLHRATMEQDLDFFMLFSSRVGVLGNPGQSNHASANAFLDQLAAHRQSIGLPGQSIAWGAWSEIGEAAEQKERIEERRSALGGRWFTPQQGIRALDKAVRQDVMHSVVMAMDWAIFKDAIEDRPAFLEDLLKVTPEKEDKAPAQADNLIALLQRTSAADRERELISFLQGELQAVLHLSDTPSPTIGFFDLGMDSLMVVELQNRLNRALEGECMVSNTAVFDYPNITLLAQHLVEELGEISTVPDVKESAEVSTVPDVKIVPEKELTVEELEYQEDHVAVVGMACRLPGASDLAAFWHLLEGGVDAVTDGRRDGGHWAGAVGDPAAESIFFKRGGFIDELDRFDAEFFGITPIDAHKMDPRHRILLETSWQALENAGIDPETLKSSLTGVYVGIGSSEYRDLMTVYDQQSNHFFGTSGSIALGRVAFVLGLMGPAIPVDMTCASSLVAVHQAVTALRRGEVDLALVGGVHALLSTSTAEFMAEYGMLSKIGKCQTFDAEADGFVRGEGCGMVVLKRQSDAESEGDSIWGLIRGSAVNQNGVSAGLTVPNGQAQVRVLKDALARAGVAPAEVDYLEVHGTGSPLGDPIEVHAAAEVYGEGREATRPLIMGTAKTNIGHLEAAAGVVGLIKVMLSMKWRSIPRHLHFKTPNPHVNWGQLPVQVASEAVSWPDTPDRPPRAGVSAFAVSGTNSHVVVEGFPVTDRNSAQQMTAGSEIFVSVPLPGRNGESVDMDMLGPRNARLLPLSGKSDAALRELAKRYLAWLDEYEEQQEDDSASASLLADMAWTAGTGRHHFSHRAGLVFRDAVSLRDQLSTLAESTNSHAGKQAPDLLAFTFAEYSEYPVGMGEELYRSEPIVRVVLDRCDNAWQAEHGNSLLNLMFGTSEDVQDPSWMFSAMFALQCALSDLWCSAGIRPATVLATGTGEIAAAYAAGSLELEDGVHLAELFGQYRGSHSQNGEATGEKLEAAVANLSLAPLQVSMLSGRSDRLVSVGELPEIAVGYLDEVEVLKTSAPILANYGVTLLIEMGPGTGSISEVVSAWPKSAKNNAISSTPTLVAGIQQSSRQVSGEILESIALVYDSGWDLDFGGLFAGEHRRRVPLPSYPFQRDRYWFDNL
ncbi:MAG: SDR family NAD(P)-dependent oxidoreductase [Rhodothermaceae bacterium]|nr:SDR family NAD(P)-dependent oxidoreductase [Rhodothermaceae bacterium]MYD68753.1 SDR family NAD(P)-dependent oxidoreductase [Rhodothermaceae bacterium]MYJ07083.1 SDR family NAD(P)-dependent oxidoreductase [Rhodothermaceae bacterium]